jgi:alkylhydroperoxidase/carboxymuconolactone decarboxylase family protein YurZ
LAAAAAAMAELRSPRPLWRFAAARAAGEARGARRALADARRAGWPRVAAEETALMLMLHAGYPAALEGLRLLNAVWPGRARRTREGSAAGWRRRGARLCGLVYGPVFPKLLRSVRDLHPDLAVWMVEHGYGRVLSRRGLSARQRELATVAVLAASGWQRQLHSHLLGARRCGARRPEIRAAFDVGRRAGGARVRGACDRAWRAAFDPLRSET